MIDQIANVELLRLLVRRDYPRVEQYLARGRFDFQSFGRFAEWHRLSGFLFKINSEANLVSLFPADLLKHFKFSFLLQSFKNKRLLKEAKHLAPLLECFSPPALFLKGPFMAHRFYGEISHRSIADLDILVAGSEDLENVDRLLTAQGYRRTSLMPLSHRVAFYFAHHYCYRKDDLALELHWALQRHFSFAIDYQRIWALHARVTINGRPYRVVSDAYELVLQVLSAFTDLQVGTFQLKSFVDVYMILRAIEKTVDWDVFFARRRRERLFLISLNILAMVLDLFECGQEFQSLAASIKRNREFRRVHGLAQTLEFLNTPRLGLRGKFRTFHLYEAPFLTCFLWWAVSLPFRLAIYR